MPLKHRDHGWIKRAVSLEWQRIKVMSTPRFISLLMLWLLTLLLCPPLPFLAYGIQWWVSPWTWQERWESLRAPVRDGCLVAGLILGITALDLAHVWIIPDLVAIVQNFWRTHLPGSLSLSPVESATLLARSLLLLPLAPALSLLYERIEPRADPHSVDIHRVLTSREVAKAQAQATPGNAPAQPDVPLETREQSPDQAAQKNPPNPAEKRTRRVPPLHRQRSRKPSREPSQMTIESFLTTETVDAADPTPEPNASPGNTSGFQAKTSVHVPASHTPAPSPHQKQAPSSTPKRDRAAPVDWKQVDE